MRGMFQVTAGSSISSEITWLSCRVSPQITEESHRMDRLGSDNIGLEEGGGRLGGGGVLITQTNGLKISSGHTLSFTTPPTWLF